MTLSIGAMDNLSIITNNVIIYKTVPIGQT